MRYPPDIPGIPRNSGDHRDPQGSSGPRDGELAEFFRAVLPDDDPPAPRGFVADARASGQRIRRARGVRIGVAVCAVFAVVAAGGFAATRLAEGRYPEESDVASEFTPTRTAFADGFSRLAAAVGANLGRSRDYADSAQFNLRAVDLPPVARFELGRKNAAGFVEVTTRNGGPSPLRPGRNCPKTNAGAPKPGSGALPKNGQTDAGPSLCQSGFLEPGAMVYVLTTTVTGRRETHELVVHAPSGTEVVLTTSAMDTRPADDHTQLAAPLSDHELLELLRHGDAAAALHSMPGMPL